MKVLIIRIGRFLKKPGFTMFMGFMLIIAGIIEIAEVVTVEFIGFDVETHHIIILFGFNQLILAISHMIEGMEDVELIREEEEIEEVQKIEKQELEDIERKK